MFWENYVELCRKIGKSPTAAAVDMGLSNAATPGWKRGVIPRRATLEKIADYFKVSVEDLLAAPKHDIPGDDYIFESNKGASLSIRIDSGILLALRITAKQNGRSLEDEIEIRLQKSLEDSLKPE